MDEASEDLRSYWLGVGVVVGGLVSLASFAYFGYCLLRPHTKRAIHARQHPAH
jgi:hypothetical protein